MSVWVLDQWFQSSSRRTGSVITSQQHLEVFARKSVMFTVRVFSSSVSGLLGAIFVCFLVIIYFLCTVYQLPQPTRTQKAITCNTVIVPVCHTLTIGAVPRAEAKAWETAVSWLQGRCQKSENQLRPSQVLSPCTVMSAQSLWLSTNNHKNLISWAVVTVLMKLVKVQHFVMIRKKQT